MDASLSHTTGIYQPLRFFKRFVAVEAIKLDRNQIKRLVLACRFDLTAIDFGNYRSPRSTSGLEGADGEPFVVRNAVSIGWHGAIYGRKGENGMTTTQPKSTPWCGRMGIIGPPERRDELTQRNEYEADMPRAMQNVRFWPLANILLTARNVRFRG
ncbi:MAG: hypothetical protein WCE24_07630 [Pseudolabrys sp.]